MEEVDVIVLIFISFVYLESSILHWALSIHTQPESAPFLNYVCYPGKKQGIDDKTTSTTFFEM